MATAFLVLNHILAHTLTENDVDTGCLRSTSITKCALHGQRACIFTTLSSVARCAQRYLYYGSPFAQPG